MDQLTAAAGLHAQAEEFFRAMSSQPPIILPQREADAATLARAEGFRFGPHESLAAWRFGAGEGPVVVLVHGWGGQGTQFLRMANALVDFGFEAIVIDAGNHGSSAPAPMGFDRFMLDARALADHLGTMPFAWIAHSAAALAIMSARRTHGISAQAYVALAAPFVPYVPLNRFRQMGASEQAVDLVKPMLARQFDAEWEALEAGLAWRGEPGSRLLAIYDHDDTMVHAGDAERIRQVWPGCRTLQTRGFGHNRLLGSSEAIDQTARFLIDVAKSETRTAR
ncbi:MAG: hypothetical protein APF78_03525 [Sphingomonadales bacterium BRH_c3]|nr:MAG: hypothetical protein APF78_03525 [Sphingomonadales bacterium BRH_c3]